MRAPPAGRREKRAVRAVTLRRRHPAPAHWVDDVSQTGLRGSGGGERVPRPAKKGAIGPCGSSGAKPSRLVAPTSSRLPSPPHRHKQILYSSVDNLSHLHLETSRRTAGLATNLDVALAVLLEDKYEAFRAAVAAADAAARKAAAARLWGAGVEGEAAFTGKATPAKPSPLAGLSPEARAAVVADRLGRLGGAACALAVSGWVLGGLGRPAAAGEAVPAACPALPAPAGSMCEPVPAVDGAAAPATISMVRPPSTALWRLVAAAAGALRGGEKKV